jgi:hypothetical protein
MTSFSQESVVMGIKRSKGEFEGNSYDSTKFYIQTSLDESKGNGKGVATAEYSFGKSDEYEKYVHLPFPFKAICDYEIVTNGKGTVTMRLTGVKPVDRAAKG